MAELSNPGDIVYESQLDIHSPAYLADYQQVQGVTVLPISVYIEMALSAAADALGQGPYELLEISFQQLLFLPKSNPRTIRIVLSPHGSNEATFQVRSLSLDSEPGESGRWNVHASGRIRQQERQEESKGLVRLKTAGRNTKAAQFSLSYFGSSEAAFTPDRYQLLIEGAKFADRHGYAAVWTPERHFNPFGGSFPAPAILSAALATITERVHLRAGSVILPLHHPVRIAEEWSVVDNLSQGRIGISFATGWSADDFVFRPKNFEQRKEVMFESLELFKKFWRGETVFLTGGSGKVTPITLFPMPKQRELPIWITVVKNPDMYERAGEIGANVLTNLLSQTPEDLTQNIKLYRQSLVRHGYDPTAGQVTLLVHTFIGRDLDNVRDTVRKPFCDYLKSTVGIIQNVITSLDLRLDLNSLTAKDMDDLLSYAFERYFQANALMGTPEVALDKIALLEEIGVNEIACFVDFGVDAKSVMESLSLLNEVRERLISIDRDRDVRVDVRDFWANARERCVESISGAEHYERLRERGMEFGPGFAGVQNIWKGEAEAIGELDLPSVLEADVEAYEFHPAMLDAGLQLFMAILPTNDKASIGDRIYAPVGIGEVRVHSKPERKMWAHVSLRPETGVNAGTLIGDLRMFDERKNLIAENWGVRLQVLETTTPTSLEPKFDHLLYALEWEPLASGLEDEAQRLQDQPGAWLIFSDDGGIGQQVSQLLSNRGQTCIHVSQGQNYLASKRNQFCIDHRNREDFKTLLRDVKLSLSMPLVGIVHLWCLDAAPTENTTTSSLRRDQALGCESAMYLLQSLAEQDLAVPPKLWLITRGAQHLGSETSPISVTQSPIWGLQRVIRIEHPELRCTVIDLDPSDTQYRPELLLAELHFNSNEDQIAFRGDKRYAPRLARRTKNSWPEKLSPSVLFRQDGTYLITGGFGVLGLILARHLINKGARHLVLVGRSGSSSPSRQVLDELRSSGAEIREMKCDVSQEEDVATVLAQIKNRMPPLRGIIHAAMWIEDSVLLQFDHERFDAAVKPKVLGAWNLHTLTCDLPLDFFVLFSSAASLLGSAGQGNYAAANAFLDALSHYRRFMKLPSLTVDWGQWAETHLQSRKGLTERMAMIGMTPLLPEQGLATLDWMVQRQCAQVMIIAANWERVAKSYPVSSRPAMLSRLSGATSGDASSLKVPLETAGLGRQRFMAMAPDNRPAWLESHILALVGKVFRLDPTQIDPHQPLNTLGLDSLMAIEIKNEIENSLAVSVPLVRLLESPDVSQLAAQVLSHLSQTTEQDENERLAALLKQVSQLSDEEAREMLAREKQLARSDAL